MEINEAITKAKEMMERKKEQLELQKAKWTKIKEEQQKRDILLSESKKKLKKELLNKWREKAEEFLKEEDNVEGIKFIGENGRFFALERGNRYALYLSSDGSFKEQHWGMYMGNNYIIKLSNDMYDAFGLETLQIMVDVDFKALVIQQILRYKK